MTLLREIQTAATDTTTDLPSLLRKARILAARLNNSEFEAWVNHELNGYETRESLPTYRIIPISAEAILTDGFRTWNGYKPAVTKLPDRFQDWGERTFLFQPIATIAALSKRESLTISWPQEIAFMYGASGVRGFQCLRAWQNINPDSLLGVLDTVRNRLLDFSLKLEAEYPYVGEAQPGREPIPAEKLGPLVVNTFYGPVGNVAQHGENFKQSVKMNNGPEDLARFTREFAAHLHELDLESRQQQRARAQLEVIQAELEGEPDEAVVAQSARSLRNITEGAIGSLLATAAQPSIWHWLQQVLSNFK